MASVKLSQGVLVRDPETKNFKAFCNKVKTEICNKNS